MLQRRWDLLGDDLRALYTDRKFAPTNDSESLAVSTPKSVALNKSKSDSKPKSNRKSKRNSEKVSEKAASDGSDCEGNLVISESPVKKASPKKTPKPEPKSNGQPVKALNSVKKSEPKLLKRRKLPKKQSLRLRSRRRSQPKRLLKRTVSMRRPLPTATPLSSTLGSTIWMSLRAVKTPVLHQNQKLSTALRLVSISFVWFATILKTRIH